MRTNVLDAGFVELIDEMGSDHSIDAAARVSYTGGKPEKRSDNQVASLLNYLMRNQHTSPFEMASMVFRVRCPIFVARQWMRHRTWSFNEISGRYIELPEEHYTPTHWRGKAASNKQGSEGMVAYSSELIYPDLCYPTDEWDGDPFSGPEEAAFAEYHQRLKEGVCPEQARMCLPLSTYTEFVGKVDLHNLLHFLSLRQDSHAQWEIRQYADAIAEIVEKRFPLTWDAYVKYRRDSVTFSRDALQCLIKAAEGSEIDDALALISSNSEKKEIKALIEGILDSS